MQPRREGSIRPDPLEQVPPDLSIAANEITWWRQGTRGRGQEEPGGGRKRQEEKEGGGRYGHPKQSYIYMHISLKGPGRLSQHAAPDTAPIPEKFHTGYIILCLNRRYKLGTHQQFSLPPIPQSHLEFQAHASGRKLHSLRCIQWEIYFLPMAENLFNHLHIIDHMLARGCKVT